VTVILRGLSLAALALASLCDNARAWSDPGHKIICEIAFRLAHQDTRAAVRRLMESDTEFKTFSDSASFPTIRSAASRESARRNTTSICREILRG
jgi:hypothetical protein